MKVMKTIVMIYQKEKTLILQKQNKLFKFKFKNK